MNKIILAFFLVFSLLPLTHAPVAVAEEKLTLPRPATIKKPANMRKGPGEEFPVIAEFRAPPVPVIITREFQQWREVTDVDGTKGWVLKLLLNNKQSAVIRSPITALLDDANGREIAQLKRGVAGYVNKCRDGFCQLTIQNYKGWVNMNDLWGLP